MDQADFVSKALKTKRKTFFVNLENGARKNIAVTRHSLGKIRNIHGDFWLYYFKVNDYWKDYYVLLKSEINTSFEPEFKKNKLILRIDSGCMTSNIFLDISCDCQFQLQRAMEEISKNGEGIIIYLPNQDGRGFGLNKKLSTMFLIYEYGLDTIQAFEKIISCNTNDIRTYYGCVGILNFFNIPTQKEILLLSGSTNKSNILRINGFSNITLLEKYFENNDIIKRNNRAKREDNKKRNS